MTGDDNPQAQQFQQGGFPGGGFGGFPGGFGFGGIDIEDLMRQGFFGGHPGGHQHHGHPGGHQQGHHGGRQRRQQYTFSFGGGDGVRFEF
jgi:hypothetical protein